MGDLVSINGKIGTMKEGNFSCILYDAVNGNKKQVKLDLSDILI